MNSIDHETQYWNVVGLEEEITYKNGKFKKKSSIQSKTLVLVVVSLFLSLFIIGTISAFEFDNIKNYDEETQTIDIRNSILGIPFLQLDQVAEIQLITPKINYVIRGKDRLVAEFTIENFKDYTDGAFDDLEFYDIKNDMDKFDRDFTYKYKTFYEVEVADYEMVCKEREILLQVNKTNNQTGTILEKYDCYQNQTGTHLEEKFNWIDFGKENDLQKGNITIGIFTDVLANENIEWIPTLFGVEINEWAEWTESLNEDIWSFWNSNADEGTNLEDVVAGENRNGTLMNMGDEDWVTGKIGNGLIFDGTNDFVNITGDDPFGGYEGNFTIVWWENRTESVAYDASFGYILATVVQPLQIGTNLSGTGMCALGSTDGVSWNLMEPPASFCGGTIDLGEWINWGLRRAGNNWTIYKNGVAVNSRIQAGTIWNSGNTFKIGASQLVDYIHATMDEIGIWKRDLTDEEMVQLYNEGDGITYTLGDTTFPYFTNGTPTNQTIEYGVALNYNINATDETEFGCFEINDTINFQINCSGWLKNNTFLNVALYNLNVSINDSSNNQNSTLFWVNVTPDITSPQIDYGVNSEVPYANLTRDNIYVNVSLIESNLENMSYYLYNETLPLENLVGYWNFDRNLTTQPDLSGNGNDGTVDGATFNSTGKLGNDYTFDGVNDKIDTGYYVLNVTETQAFTFCSWIYLNSIPTLNDGGIISKGYYQSGGFQAGSELVVQKNTGVLKLTVANGSKTDNSYYSNPLNINEYIYVCGMFNGTHSIVCVNGDCESNLYNLENGIVNREDASLYIGARHHSNPYLNASMDEVMIFNKSLSQEEVSDLYYRDLVNHTTYSTPTLEINWTGLPDNDYHYFVDALDTSSNYNSTEIRTLLMDVEYPYFLDNTPQNQTITYGESFEYNINATDSLGLSCFTVNDTINFKINCSGYLENNTILGVALYNLNVTINDSSNKMNSSFFWINVTQAGNPTSTLLNGIANNLSVIFPQQVNVSTSNNLTTVTIDVNGTTFISGSNYTLGAGVWFVNISTEGNQNYSANESNWYITVNQSGNPTATLLNGIANNLSVIFPQQSNVSISGNLTLATIDVNGTTFTNSNNYTLGAGVWFVNVSSIGNQNYTSNESNWYITVNQSGDTFDVLLNGILSNLTVTFPQQVNVSVSNNLSILNIDVNGTTFNNAENYTIGGGVWFVNISTEGNQNYTSNESNWYITMNRAIPTGSITGTSPITYGTASDVEGTESNIYDNDLVYRLLRGGTIVSNPDTDVLGVNTYNYIYNVTGGQNYTSVASLDTFSLTVDIETGAGTLLLNGSATNYTINRTANVNISAVLDTGFGDISVYIDTTLFQTGSSPISDEEQFNTLGWYLINFTYPGNENYTGFEKYLYVNVTANPLAIVNIVYPLSGTDYEAHFTELNYTILYGVNCWYNLGDGVGYVLLTCGDNVTGITSIEGSNTWTIKAENLDGFNTTDSISFTIDLPIEYSKFTLRMVDIIKILIMLAGLFIIVMAGKSFYAGEMTFGRLITIGVTVSLGVGCIILLGPIVINYISDLIK